MTTRTFCARTITIAAAASFPTAASPTTFDVPEQGNIALIVQNLAQPGDTLSIDDGVYSGIGYTSITLEELPLTIMSRNGDPATCVFDLSGTSGFDVSSSSGTFRFEGIGFRNANGRAIEATQPTIVSVRRCRFESNASPAVTLRAGEIADCEFVDNAGSEPSLLLASGNSRIARSSFVGNSGLGARVIGAPSPADTIVVTDCRFEANQGGGLQTTGDGFALIDTDFSDNGTLDVDSGGGYRGDHQGGSRGVLIRDCRFERNEAVAGGGALILGPLSIEHTTFADNSSYLVGGAAAIYHENGLIECELATCEFIDNSSGEGGGIYFAYNTGAICVRECTFLGNVADSGGGISLSGSATATLVLDRCTMARNLSNVRGAAIDVDGSDLLLEQTTLVLNTGSEAISVDGDVELALDRTIIAFNSAMSIQPDPGFTGSVNFTCTDMFGNAAGGDWDAFPGWLGNLGNIETDPLFCDCSSDDYTVASESPCLPSNNSCGEMLGSMPAGCSTPLTICGDQTDPVEKISWSTLKGRFR